MTTVENFRNFLIITGNYGKFCHNVAEQKGLPFEDIACRRNMRDVIDNAMSWAQCPEGREYWSDVNTAWQTAFDKGTEFHNRCKSIW